MTWAAAQARVHARVASAFGSSVTYKLRTGATATITAAPGDITTQGIEENGRMVGRQTCIWNVKASELTTLLAGGQPARGDRIIAAVGYEWVIDTAQPDDPTGLSGWQLFTYRASDVSVAAPGVERSK